MSDTNSFERFQWLYDIYAENFSPTDIGTLSEFERWEHLWNQLRPVAGLVGHRNLDALDRLDNREKADLLNWLEIQRRRNTSAGLADPRQV